MVNKTGIYFQTPIHRGKVGLNAKLYSEYQKQGGT